MTPATLRALVTARAEGRAAVLATRLRDGAQALWPGEADGAVGEAAAAALAQGRTGVVGLAGEAWFLHVHLPDERLLLVGAVHIAQALASLAGILGMALTVIDPRPTFNSAARFPAAARVLDWPDLAMERLRPDARTAVVVLAHDPKLDDPALDRALRSAAFYVGALGSRRSHASRLERLSALGHDQDALARIRGPVGLAIGAVSAQEIALSILAEIVAVRRNAALAARR